MEAATAIAAAQALTTLIVQLAPVALEINQAIQNNDEAGLKAVLARLQAANDKLGQA